MTTGSGLQIWKSEGAEYITEKVPADTKTIFIDGQIILMQSRVDGCRTWREFALNVFGRRLLVFSDARQCRHANAWGFSLRFL